MLTEVQERWLCALESGKYAQGHYRLVENQDRYCCLGVACIVLGFMRIDSMTFRSSIGELRTTLSHGTYEQLGLLDESGAFKNNVKIDEHDHWSLMSMNDCQAMSFADIAAYVRANPGNVFVSETNSL